MTNVTPHAALQLPVELWKIIFGYLPSTAARTCLSLSRLFHDLAAPQLFSTLRIHLGSWKSVYGIEAGPPSKESERRYELSCALLDNIHTDAVFASYVKHFYVLAFVFGGQAEVNSKRFR